MLRSSAALALVCLVSCRGDEAVPPFVDVKILPAIPNRNLDVLFVIDDSTGMLEQQNALAAAFPQLIAMLSTGDGELPDLHIGVVSTDMGTTATSGSDGPAIGSGPGSCAAQGKNGVLQNLSPDLMGRFVIDRAEQDGSRTVNYNGELANVLGRLVRLGSSGCGFEQPLHAMRRALENTSENAGFLRAEANLAIVIVADEDDCSFSDPALIGADTARFGPLQSFRCTRFGVTCDDGGETPDAMNEVGPKFDCHSNESSPVMSDVESYVDFLTTLKADPHAVMISVIAGDAEPLTTELRTPPGGGSAILAVANSCSYTGSQGPWVADPAVRLEDFSSRFPARADMTSICNGDYSSSAQTIGRAMNQLLGDPCVDASLGSQPRCEVVDGPPGAEVPIPNCSDDDSATCWSLVPDSDRCAGIGDSLRLVIVRPAAPTTQVYSHLRCQTR